jgi:hypothetical protein
LSAHDWGRQGKVPIWLLPFKLAERWAETIGGGACWLPLLIFAAQSS